MNLKTKLFFLVGMISFSQVIVAGDANKNIFFNSLVKFPFWKINIDNAGFPLLPNFARSANNKNVGNKRLRFFKFVAFGKNKKFNQKTSLLFMKAEIAKQLYLQKNYFKISQL